MFVDKPRCLILFEESCKSAKTLSDYRGFLDKFLKWGHKDYESFMILPKSEIQNLLIDYCISLKRRCENGDFNPNSFPSVFNGVFKFLEVNDIEFNRKKITMLFPERVKQGGAKAITTEQARILIDTTGKKREKALIHIFCATGARPEAVCELQIKNVVSYQEGFYKLVLYPGSTHEMTHFLHPEAVQALENYFEYRRLKGERLGSESFVFKSEGNRLFDYKPRKMDLSTLENIMFRLWNSSGIKRNKVGKRYDLASVYSMRKRFNTLLEFNPDISLAVTQYLMDHTGYMSGHYRKPTDEMIFQEYKKAVKDLMLSDEYRQKEELRNKDEIIKQKETEKDKVVLELKTRLDSTEKILLELKKRLDS